MSYMKSTTKKEMKIKFLQVALLSIGLNVVAFAQDNYTLEKCVSYAMENQSSIKKAQLESDLADAKIKETISVGLPQINGKVDFMKNFDVQKQFLPADAFNPLAPAGLITPVGFGVDYSMNANLQLTQMIFDGSYIVGLQASKEVKRFADIGLKKSKEDVVYNVTSAYYGAIVNKDRKALLSSNLEQLEALLTDSKVMFENGVIEKIDLQQLEVNINNLKVQIDRVDNGEKISKELLKLYMGLESTEELMLEGEIEDFIDGISDELSPKMRIDEELLGQQKVLQELNLKNEKVQAYPKLYGFVSGGWNKGENDFAKTFDFGTYEPYSMLGLSLDVPIFSSFRRSHRLQQNRLEVSKIDMDLKMLKQKVEFDKLNAQLTLRNSKNAISLQEKTLELAREVYRVNQIKYKEGVISNFELLQSESSLQQSQTNYYLAVYEALTAYVNYAKATGNLTSN